MSVANTHLGANRISELLHDKKSVFFVGIGGINMSSLAHLTHGRGLRVGGSDRTVSALTERLRGEGVEIFYSHDAANVDGYEVLVYTVAITEDNPEYKAAIARGIPCISRADYMGYLMTEYKNRIGISGMHGKSTCTSMCAEVLMAAGSDPTVLSGAELSSMGGAYRVGAKTSFLFEACEYMDSFLDFNPTISVILNVEEDHVDYFESLEHIKRSFFSFASIAAKAGGTCVANLDDKNVTDTLVGYSGRLVGFGIENANAEYRAVNIEQRNGYYSFSIARNGFLVCDITLRVAGYHNIYNALATAAATALLGIGWRDIKKGIEEFGGAARRMEYKGSLSGARVYDDYAHHPTEIEASLRSAREMLGEGGRLFCVFQSHTYSRTAALMDGFSRALSIADRAIICDVYAAREIDTMGVTPELIADRISCDASACHSFADAARTLERELRAGDVAIVMGAGDVWHVFDTLRLNK